VDFIANFVASDYVDQFAVHFTMNFATSDCVDQFTTHFTVNFAASDFVDQFSMPSATKCPIVVQFVQFEPKTPKTFSHS
jgi:hypothetical protein